LLDIGSGALGKLHHTHHYPHLDAVFVTHMHADHFFDLVPLRQGLKYDTPSRAQRMPLWLPPGGAIALEALRRAVAPDAAPDFFDEVFAVREYDPDQSVTVKDLQMTFARTRHYIEGYAMRVRCDGASLFYTSDTAPCDSVVEHARESSLFLCEAALGLGGENGEVRGHSSAQEAGEMAKRAGAKRLAITHYSANWEGEELLEAARKSYDGPVVLVNDGMHLTVE
ncbi:MAG TPA: MBL fold metallo-hydrolase, partial [Candidatus Cybelea sp.]|nr:MBL fold metallo-hydrolase [Candidatus Cybelea sp.]